MGIEKVKEEVLSKAKRQAAQIIAEGKKEEEQITKAAEEKAQARKKDASAEIEKEISEIKVRELAAAELETKKILLETKKKNIESVLEGAKERISKSSIAERKEHIKKLISRAKSRIEIGKILCNEKDIKFIDGYIAIPTGISGGIIVENKDGTIRIDYSYESILEKTKEEKLKDVAKILFKE